MNIKNDFDTICSYAHFRNWAPDWDIAKQIYSQIPTSYSVLTPFAYSYLEELIRSTTSEYGRVFVGKKEGPSRRRVGMRLIELAISENQGNREYIELLNEATKYFRSSTPSDEGNNRHSVAHGYMHPIFWNQASFEELIHFIATISKYSNF